MDPATSLHHLIERPTPEPGDAVKINLGERTPIGRDDRRSGHERLDVDAAERLGKLGHAHDRLGVRHERLAFLGVDVADDLDVFRRREHTNLLEALLGILSRNQQLNAETLGHLDRVLNTLGRADATHEQEIIVPVLHGHNLVDEIAQLKVIGNDRLLRPDVHVRTLRHALTL